MRLRWIVVLVVERLFANAGIHRDTEQAGAAGPAHQHNMARVPKCCVDGHADGLVRICNQRLKHTVSILAPGLHEVVLVLICNSKL